MWSFSQHDMIINIWDSIWLLDNELSALDYAIEYWKQAVVFLMIEITDLLTIVRRNVVLLLAGNSDDEEY